MNFLKELNIKQLYPLVWMLCIAAFEGRSQDTVLKLLINDVELADNYFEQKNYHSALNLYLNAFIKNQRPFEVNLKIARSYYFLKQYDLALAAYEKSMKQNKNIPLTDLYFYAEAQSAKGNYEKAVEYYKKYLVEKPQDELVFKKIWRLNNIRYLYEDSSYYDVRYISINSQYSDLCAVPYSNGIVFASNRKQVEFIEQIDASLNAPFYRLYYSKSYKDTLTSGQTLKYNDPVIFIKGLTSRFHTGPVNFYQQANKAVFATTGGETDNSLAKTLQLNFAEKRNGSWEITGAFPFNSNNHSISNPTISEDGMVLIFSSDMKGGYGGKDLYRSEFINGKWTKPTNLGEPVNTAYDEEFPYLHLNQTLYFSSNGHAGLGGLDIFKTDIYSDGFGEVENMGYPLNTNHDDFGITIDSLTTHGYFTSNRKEGGYNDDIYEFDMDIQAYPLEITGIIKYIEHSWADSSDLKVLPDVKLFLIDNVRNITVAETGSDSLGNFTINIPYYSTYKMRVSGPNIGEGIVSFVVPKYRKLKGQYQIVVVKDDFKLPANEQ